MDIQQTQQVSICEGCSESYQPQLELVLRIPSLALAVLFIWGAFRRVFVFSCWPTLHSILSTSQVYKLRTFLGQGRCRQRSFSWTFKSSICPCKIEERMPWVLLLFVFLSHSLCLSPDVWCAYTSLYTVGLNVAVMILQALFSSGSIFLASLDLVCGSAAPQLEFANSQGGC